MDGPHRLGPPYLSLFEGGEDQHRCLSPKFKSVMFLDELTG
jgi:hypothetical protein